MVNDERQLQALVDKKKVIITETSIISDLHLEDVGGTDCLPTATMFEKLARMRRKQRKETEVPQDETHYDDSVPIPSNDPLLSGEDRMKLTELMILCTNLQKHVLDLEKVKDAQAKENIGLKKREDASKQGRSFEDIDKDAEVSLVDETQGRSDDAEMFDTIQDVFIVMSIQAEHIEEERHTRKQYEEANITLIESWDNAQAIMEDDRLLAE
ncbi:hypothetical protein Tco_1161703 [Tanacetum coccineum]